MEGLENVKHIGIDDIEKELEDILASDKKGWVRIYELMDLVENLELFKPRFKSFTQWVNSLADKTKVHVSTIWKAKKAGKSYAAYQQRAVERGINVPDMEAVQVSADNLELIDKIAGSNDAVADDLIDKVVDGQLNRQDLRNAWATVKAERSERAKHAENSEEPARATEEHVNRFTPDVLAAADIIYGLMNSDWLPEKHIPDRQFNEVSLKYRMFSEFPVVTGSSRNARRIDALIAENFSVPELRDKAYEVALHGIEIKVDKNDLWNDHKMAEYTDFVDYFWIAVPGELVETAESLALPEWGIIAAYEPNNLKIFRPAKKLPAINRDITLATVVLKTL